MDRWSVYTVHSVVATMAFKLCSIYDKWILHLTEVLGSNSAPKHHLSTKTEKQNCIFLSIIRQWKMPPSIPSPNHPLLLGWRCCTHTVHPPTPSPPPVKCKLTALLTDPELKDALKIVCCRLGWHFQKYQLNNKYGYLSMDLLSLLFVYG